MGRKYKDAVAGIEATEPSYKELTTSLDQENIREWTQQVLKAEENRGEALDVYALRTDKGWYQFYFMLALIFTSFEK